jgi:hypothetical protein
MSNLYIAVDCGKYNTKTAWYNAETKKSGEFKFRTKMSKGTFEDDMFDRNTMIASVDGGPIVKIGNGGKQEPDAETSKKTDIHRFCTLTAVAEACRLNNAKDADIVIGIPLSIAAIPEERIAYKDFILGQDQSEHTVKLKFSPDKEPVDVKFAVKKRYVYPEGTGVLYEYPAKLSGPAAIIDIGNINTNNIYSINFLPQDDKCFASELGGKGMISGLAETLTAELGARCDENLTAATLLKPYEQRYLKPKNGNKEIEEKSRKIIDDYLRDYVKSVKNLCETRKWPLEYMDIVCVGGTTALVKKELTDVFGENLFIPPEPEFVNAKGFLKRLCVSCGVKIEVEKNAA